jgi:cytochrome c2
MRWLPLVTLGLGGILIAWLPGCGPREPRASPDEVAALLASADADAARREALVAEGAKVFTRMACATCHGTSGQGAMGPKLRDLMGRSVKLSDGRSVVADRTYLYRSIVSPRADVVAAHRATTPMSSYAHLPAQDVAALIALVESWTVSGE